MKYWFWIVFIVAGFSSCAMIEQNAGLTNSSVQSVDMGKFNGLRIVEIAALNFPDNSAQSQGDSVFSDIDKENFGGSLIQSLKKSDVRVLPSAQTKIHIDFTELALVDDNKSTIIKLTADVAVSRNGIISRKTIEIISETKLSLGRTKNNGVKLFIQELGDFLRDQSSFKR